MTEPQVWVLIGVFAAAIFGMTGIVTTSFHRTLTASIEKLEAKIDALDAKFTAKFEMLDRDIQAISRHVFGTDPH
ncbi:MAG TPA: hypothetical protein PK781_08765 [Terrimesophilobacter sp.]|nr:hypothetical protein [Terrimesophilobacter sp.]HRQ00537.1 hypothetical protein [Terrimesophilobacter sp.]